MKMWKKRGHNVRILTLSDRADSYKDDSVYYIKSVPIRFIYPDMRMPISYRNMFIDELVEWKPDIIHSQCEFFSFQFAKHISKHTDALLKNQKLIFLIVGGGPDKRNMEILTSNLGIGSNVIFIGMVEPSQVQEYYHFADVMETIYETIKEDLTEKNAV